MKKGLITIAAMVLLGIGWYLISPLFINEVVNEEPIMMETDDSDMKEMESSDRAKEDEAASSSKEMMTEDTKDETESLMGMFMDGDSSHKASGEVLVSADHIRLENIEVTNGPDLYVYLVDKGQETKQGVSLGKLKGNIGNQNYELPAGTEIKEGMKIVIWCKQFNVDFGYAVVEKGA
ncbi:DM13 domain-containing protein [Bacillus sp. 2205SS5-2]|uniref:DM13 domain-containing protein n=1 Tax=Bacillus sp. 2205SS5-2 TaxID=3109031 RepID=UPI003003DC21